MLKVMFFGVASIAAAGAASAQSADAPSWSGPYVGVHAGYGFDDGRKQDVGGTTAGTNGAIAAGNRPIQLNNNRQGFIGGGQAGWNFQRDRFVFGPEGTFSYLDQRGTTSLTTLNAAGAPQNTTVRNRMEWMASARARAGYTLGDGLVYATGGYAVAKVRGSAAFNGPTGAQLYSGRNAYTAQGWLAGLGGELRPFHDGSMSRVSFGVEATYYDLGRNHTVANATTTANTGAYIVGRNARGFNGVVRVNYGF